MLSLTLLKLRQVITTALSRKTSQVCLSTERAITISLCVLDDLA
jgi:hypothetical protein